MQANEVTPKFIQRIKIPVVQSNKPQQISEANIESVIIKILKKGIGLWKEESPELCIVVEIVKNRFDENDLQWIESHKDFLFAYLENNKKYYPLSFSQQMMCVQSELYKNASYQITIPLFINRDIHQATLVNALQIVINRHSILRAIFPKIQHHWIQLILPNQTAIIEFLDFSELTQSDQKQKISQLIQSENASRFDIEHGPLYKIICAKLNPQRQLMLLNIHHTIFDGLSFPIFIHELMQAYAVLLQKSTQLNLPTLAAQYPYFVLDQIQTNEQVKNSEIEWWKQQLKNCPLQTDIPSDYQDSKQKNSERNEFITLTLSEPMQKSFVEFCKTMNLSITLFILSGIYLLLHRRAQQSDLVIGTILNQRNRVEYEALIGDFNNLVPLRLQISKKLTYHDLLKLVQKTFFDAYSHQKITFNELIQHLNIKRNKNNLPFYNVFLDSLNFDAFQRNFSADNVEMPTQQDFQPQVMPLMDLFFLLVQQSGQLVLHCAYNQNLLMSKTVSEMLAELQAILVEIIQDPSKKIEMKMPKKKIHSKQETRPAIFCLPGAEGQTGIFSRLTPALTSYRCYAFKYKGSDGQGASPLSTIEEIADNFIAVMKSLQPDEHSILIGLSTGGIVAFEMLRALYRQKLSFVSRLILIDSPPPNEGNHIIYHGEEFQVGYQIDLQLLLVLNFAIKFFGMKNASILENNEFQDITKDMTQIQKEQMLFEWIKTNTTMPVPSFPQFQSWLILISTNLNAVFRYIAQPYTADMKVDYIASSQSDNPFALLLPDLIKPPFVDKQSSWVTLFPKAKIDFFTVPSTDHYTMLAGKNIKIIHDQLIRIIENKP